MVRPLLGRLPQVRRNVIHLQTELFHHISGVVIRGGLLLSLLRDDHMLRCQISKHLAPAFRDSVNATIERAKLTHSRSQCEILLAAKGDLVPREILGLRFRPRRHGAKDRQRAPHLVLILMLNHSV